MHHLHSNLSQPIIAPIFSIRYWIIILIYIKNLVVKILIIIELIIDETSCPLCKLDHSDKESIEGKYKTLLNVNSVNLK